MTLNDNVKLIKSDSHSQIILLIYLSHVEPHPTGFHIVVGLVNVHWMEPSFFSAETIGIPVLHLKPPIES